MKLFDIVIANMLLHHVNDIDKAISEVNRVLKKRRNFFIVLHLVKMGL